MRSRLPALAVLLLAVLLVTSALGSEAVRAGFHDWRHTADLAGDLREVDGPGGRRDQPAVVALGDGRVLLWGGRGTTPDSGHVHDPRTGTWQDLPPAPGPSRFAAASAWTGREAVIWGGSTRQSEFDFDPGGVAYDPAAGRWRALPPAPVGLYGARAYPLDGGLLVAGGEQQRSPAAPVSLWLDAGTGTWTAVPAPLAVRDAVVDGGLLVATGPPVTSAGPVPEAAWPVLAFDPASLTWRHYAEPLPADWAALATAADGSLSAVAADGLDGPLRAYTWTGAVWERVAETRRGRSGLALVEPVGYPPVVERGGGRLWVGGEGGLTSWDPQARQFAHLSDPRFRTFGGSARWADGRLVALANQASEGWVFTPR